LGEHSGSESRTKVVQAVLERNGMTAAELNGEARDIVLKSFVSGAAWYHDPDVDDLSKQKPSLLLQDWFTCPGKRRAIREKANALESSWANVVARLFIGPVSLFRNVP
jgi:hypothetical protein